MHGYTEKHKVNTLELTDSELYELGMKALIDKLGIPETQRFIRQCQPGTGDYSVDRHQLLANQPDIDTIAKRIQERCTARADERTSPRPSIRSESA